MERVKVVYGDLTTFSCDAIVNSANPYLLAGSGLCGAIHKRAGANLESECKVLGKTEVGSAVLTKSYELIKNGIPWIIHAVGPRWLGGVNHEVEKLEAAYRSCIRIANDYAKVYERQMHTILKQYFKGKMLEEEVASIKQYIVTYPIKHIAFPAIGVGIYHFPIELSATIAKKVLIQANELANSLEKISIVCKDKEVYDIYKVVFEEE